MEAIKKKMQAMKLEKDNAMDQADACEQATKDAKIRAEKAEEEVSTMIGIAEFCPKTVFLISLYDLFRKLKSFLGYK